MDGLDVPFRLSRLLESLDVDEGNIPEDTVVVVAIGKLRWLASCSRVALAS